MKFGYLLFTGFQALDVFGPLDALNTLSFTNSNISLSLIAETLDPVSTRSPVRDASWPDFYERIVPTHTFDTAPDDLDVLIIPGGPGTRNLTIIQPAIDFAVKTYPTLQYLLTVCTGATIAAQGGLLDGRNATTNKRAYRDITALSPEVNWIPHARWVTDGNIWTSSGVSAGLDLIFAFIGAVWGEDVALSVANGIEYERHTNSAWDPFAELYGL